MPKRSDLIQQKLVTRVIEMYHKDNMKVVDIADQLRAEGYKTSKSAVGRAIKQHAEYLKEIEAARREAEAIIEATKQTPGMEIADATMQITITKLLAELKSIEDFEDLETEQVLNAISKISRAQGYLAKVKLDYAKGYRKGLFDAAREADEKMKKLGISKENADAIRATILGLNDGK